jgi:heptosyltransferase-1
LQAAVHGVQAPAYKMQAAPHTGQAAPPNVKRIGYNEPSRDRELSGVQAVGDSGARDLGSRNVARQGRGRRMGSGWTQSAACQNRLVEPPHADRVLVIRLGALGDVVRTLPAFVEVRARYPHAHLAWLVERGAESAVRAQPGVDEVIVFPREELESFIRARRAIALAREAHRFVRALRHRDFDLVLDFHSILKSGVISWLSGAATRVGYDEPFSREGAQRFANHRARIEPARISRYARNAALVDFLGIGLPTAPSVDQAPGACGEITTPANLLPVDSARRERFAALLEEATAAAPVVIHPGSSRGTPYKRYPIAAWGEVASALVASGERCIVSAGPVAGEAELAAAVVAASGGAAKLAPATASLGDLVALFAQCRLFLGCDSGPLHVASLVGVPVVQLLGPTDPVENAPWPGTPSRSLRVPLGCSPCRRGCSAAPCLQLLPARSVIAAAQELLAGLDAGDRTNASLEPRTEAR